MKTIIEYIKFLLLAKKPYDKVQKELDKNKPKKKVGFFRSLLNIIKQLKFIIKNYSTFKRFRKRKRLYKISKNILKKVNNKID